MTFTNLKSELALLLRNADKFDADELYELTVQIQEVCNALHQFNCKRNELIKAYEKLTEDIK